MSYPERQTIREVRYVNCWSPRFWGLWLVVVGVVAFLPDELSRYAWATVAVAAGLWLLFGPLDRLRQHPHGRFEDPSDRL